MSVNVRKLILKAFGLLSVPGLLLLTGCGAGTLAGPDSTSGFTVSGHVHGGPFPIQNGLVRLMETTSTGTWIPATGSYTGSAKQLLDPVYTDDAGYFTFTSKAWTCDAGQFVYVQISGGHTNRSASPKTDNNGMVQIGVVGSCSGQLSTQASFDNANVFVSEVSTVAAAYTLGNFISITAPGTSGQIVNITAPAANNSPNPGCSNGNGGVSLASCTYAGLAHGFTNAYNLVDSVTYGANEFPTGQARAALPTNANTVAPQRMLNTIGNILQACVDSGSPTDCTALFTNATPPETTTAPANTLQVALNMARFPNNNVDQLYKLRPAVTFFGPDLASDRITLNDGSTPLISYTLSVFFGGGTSADAGGASDPLTTPADLALDAQDNAYVLYKTRGFNIPFLGQLSNMALVEFGANGSATHGPDIKPVQATIVQVTPGSVAVDAAANIYVTNDRQTTCGLLGCGVRRSDGDLLLLDSNFQTAQDIPVPGGYAAGIAIDTSSNVWVSRDSDDNGDNLFQFSPQNGYNGNGSVKIPVSDPIKKIMYFDGKKSGVMGVTSSTSNNGQVFAYSDVSGNSSAVMLNATYSSALTMGSDQTVYLPGKGELDSAAFQNHGKKNVKLNASVAVSNDSSANSKVPMGIAIDGSGNLFWPDDEASGRIYWFQPNASSSTQLTSFLPCYEQSDNGPCYGPVAFNFHGMAIDSTGALWYGADWGGTGMVIETFGMAAPTYPLLQAGLYGQPIQ